MDGAENIINKIKDDAHLQASYNIEKAQKEAENILKATADTALQKRNSILKKAQEEVSEKRKRLVAIAELEGRKIRLKAKQELISEVFTLAQKKINSLPPEKYRDVLVDMVISLFPTGDEEIIVSSEDKQKLGDSFIKIVNTKLKERKIKCNIKYAEESREVGGGFILKSGNIETNNSFDSILKMGYNEIEAEVIKVLFS